MQRIATLLLVLLLPAFLLPEGARLCLCRLVGAAAPGSCCVRPCCASKPSATPTLRSPGCGGCKVAALDRSTVTPSRDTPDLRGDSLAAAPACIPFEETSLDGIVRAPRVNSFLRDELRRPPQLLARAQPLRL